MVLYLRWKHGHSTVQKLCVGAVHSTRSISHLFYVDTWGSDEKRRSRIPSNLLEVVNSFLLQQKPSISVTSFQMLNVPPQQESGCCVNEFTQRLSEHITAFFSMQHFEPSFLLRTKQAKEMLDFVLGIWNMFGYVYYMFILIENIAL